MSRTPADLSVLSRREGAAGASVPRPAFRWTTRVLLPALIVLAATGVLAYAARDALAPAIDVNVVPVVVTPRSLAETGAAAPTAPTTVVAQAPGWVEPDPFAITVQALIPGVVEEVLVLEGQEVEAGQVVVRLVNDEERLAAERFMAELEERRAAMQRARVAVRAAQARHAELADEVQRKEGLVEIGGVSAGEYARMVLRLNALASEVELARAMVVEAEAAVRTYEIACDEAALALERTVIRAPVSGVVLARLVEPGAQVGMGRVPGEARMSGLLRLYDPRKLQVRADVPLADAAKVSVGTIAEITTEAAPGEVFRGVVSRIVHEADIQRNTVQAKVRIEDPSPILKPEMLARVRFLSAGEPAGASDGAVVAHGETGTLRLLAPEMAMFDRSRDRAIAWVVEAAPRGRGHVARRREITLGSPQQDGYIEVVSGLRPGDRLILDPPAGLEDGARIHPGGEPADRHDANGVDDHGVH